MKKIIYLDNAATTKVAPEVVEAMLPYFTEYYGNPSSVYELAGISKKAVTEGREKVASVIGANPNDIYFTAGGSESDNWALKATYEAYKSKGNHIITTKIEHHAILHTCEWLVLFHPPNHGSGCITITGTVCPGGCFLCHLPDFPGAKPCSDTDSRRWRHAFRRTGGMLLLRCLSRFPETFL